jgi:hypothetical protein
MPNPIAHPAAAIPFTKVGLVFSALVATSTNKGLFPVLAQPEAGRRQILMAR